MGAFHGPQDRRPGQTIEQNRPGPLRGVLPGRHLAAHRAKLRRRPPPSPPHRRPHRGGDGRLSPPDHGQGPTRLTQLLSPKGRTGADRAVVFRRKPAPGKAPRRPRRRQTGGIVSRLAETTAGQLGRGGPALVADHPLTHGAGDGVAGDVLCPLCPRGGTVQPSRRANVRFRQPAGRGGGRAALFRRDGPPGAPGPNRPALPGWCPPRRRRDFCAGGRAPADRGAARPRGWEGSRARR